MASINGVTIPATIDNHGSYKYTPAEIVGKNGLGELVVAGFASITWTFPYMTFSDFDWWRVTLLTNLRYRRFTAAQLWDDGRTLTSFTNCIVNRPTYEKISSGAYTNVTVLIEQLQ